MTKHAVKIKMYSTERAPRLFWGFAATAGVAVSPGGSIVIAAIFNFGSVLYGC